MVRYYLIQVRMDIVENTKNDDCWRGSEERVALMHCEM